MHDDIWGPSAVATPSGFRYYLLLVNDFSRYSWLNLLKQKSDVFSVFTKFRTQVENFLSTNIKCLRTDGGGEFINGRFIGFLSGCGILHQFVCPCTPAQNVVVERKHRHVVETVVALLHTASMPLRFWGEAALTVVYLINRMPTSVLQGDSPYHKLVQKQPNYNFLRNFGCAYYPWL